MWPSSSRSQNCGPVTGCTSGTYMWSLNGTPFNCQRLIFYLYSSCDKIDLSFSALVSSLPTCTSTWPSKQCTAMDMHLLSKRKTYKPTGTVSNFNLSMMSSVVAPALIHECTLSSISDSTAGLGIRAVYSLSAVPTCNKCVKLQYILQSVLLT